MQKISAFFKKNTWLTLFISLVIFIILMTLVTGGKYIEWNNIIAVLSHLVIPSCIACALTFLFTAGIDLSLGAVLLLSGFMGAALAETMGWGYFGLVLGCIGVCVVLLLLNSFLFNTLKVPSWAGSLGLTLIYEAVGIYYGRYMMSHGGQIYGLRKYCLELAKIPWIYIFAVIIFVVTYLIYYNTKIGLDLRASSTNKKVAQLMGININKTVTLGFVVGAVLLGCASMINVSYNRQLSASSGLTSITSLFKPMAIMFMGIALEKYVNRVIGIIISGFVVMSLFNAMTHLGIETGTFQNVGLGLVIILLGILAGRRNKGVVK